MTKTKTGELLANMTTALVAGAIRNGSTFSDPSLVKNALEKAQEILTAVARQRSKPKARGGYPSLAPVAYYGPKSKLH